MKKPAPRTFTSSCARCGKRHLATKDELGRWSAEPCPAARSSASPSHPRGKPSGEPGCPSGPERDGDAIFDARDHGPAGIQIVTDPTMPPGTVELRSSIDSVRIEGLATGKRGRGKVCYREGHRLDSQAEGILWDQLRLQCPESDFFPHVAFPLLRVTAAHEPVRRFTVDLVLRRPRGALEAHEVKGPKVLDSRDFCLRWGAFKAAYGTLMTTTLWRVERGVLRMVR